MVVTGATTYFPAQARAIMKKNTPEACLVVVSCIVGFARRSPTKQRRLGTFGRAAGNARPCGVIAYMVAPRRNEISVRIALETDRAGVIRLVLREDILLLSIGLDGLSGCAVLPAGDRARDECQARVHNEGRADHLWWTRPLRTGSLLRNTSATS
jgi:hypothetical protein